MLIFGFFISEEFQGFLLVPSCCCENIWEFRQVLLYFWEFCILLARFCCYFEEWTQRFGDFPRRGGSHWISCFHGSEWERTESPYPPVWVVKNPSGNGAETGKKVRRKREAIQHGGGRLGRMGLSVGHSAPNTGSQCPEIWSYNTSKLGVILSHAFGSHCPKDWVHVTPHFEVKMCQNWGLKCTTLRGHDILHFGVKVFTTWPSQCPTFMDRAPQICCHIIPHFGVSASPFGVKTAYTWDHIATLFGVAMSLTWRSQCHTLKGYDVSDFRGRTPHILGSEYPVLQGQSALHLG